MVGFLPFFKLPGGATGKAQVGMAPEAAMFMNFFKAMDSLQASGDPSIAYPAFFTTDGYPKDGTLASGAFGQAALPGDLLQTELLTLKFSGTGRIALSVNAGFGLTDVNLISGSIIGGTDFGIVLDGANAHVEFRFVNVPSSIIIAFPPATYSGMSDLVFCRQSDETAVDAITKPEDVFRSQWIAEYIALNPKTTRPMGWANVNFGNVSQSRYIPNWKTAFSFQNPAWPNGAWAGTTTQGAVGATSPYTCGSQPDATGSYVDGEMIQFQFDKATSGVPITLKFGSRSVKSAILGTGGATGSPLAFVNANTLWTATYDKVTDAFWCQPDGQSPCIPYEIQVGFANRINADYWCNLPVYADNATVTAITTIVRDGLNAALNGFIEMGNEPWNNGFPMAHYLSTRGAALGFDSGNARTLYGAQGLRLRKIMEVVTSAWSPRMLTQLKRVMNVHQIAYGDVPTAKLYLLEGKDLNGTSFPNYAAQGFSNYDTAPNRPMDWCDVLSYAVYYQGAQTNDLDVHYTDAGLSVISSGGPSGWTTGLIGAADAFAAGGSTNIANAFAFLDWDIRHGTAGGVAGPATLDGFNSGQSIGYGAIGVYDSWETVIATYTAQRAAFAVPMADIEVHLYEGAFQGWYLDFLQACITIGLSSSSTVTISNSGSHPTVTWASNPLENGACVGFVSTTGGLPDNGEIGLYNSNNDANKYFVINRTSAGFDIALTPGGAAIIPSGAQSGTHTATGSIYGGKGGRFAVLLDAFKKDQLFYNIVRDPISQFMSRSHSKTPVYFLVPGPSEWSMSTGDVFAPKYKSWDAIVDYNHGR